MGEAEVVPLDCARRWSAHETAQEQGWLLEELEQRFGYGLEELARRFDRSVSWVSRRPALVEMLPEAIQQQVRASRFSAHVAVEYLVPVARVNLEDCQRMAGKRRRTRSSSRAWTRPLACAAGRCPGVAHPSRQPARALVAGDLPIRPPARRKRQADPRLR
jgi:hypothetical protein